MKHRKRQTSRTRAEARKGPRVRADRDRVKRQADLLMKEVEEANAHIANPNERERVIPSRPC
jgi:stress response protein YsnF